MQDVLDELRNNAWVKRRKIKIERTGNVILLTGTTGSFYQKQQAQELALRFLRTKPEKIEVRNEIFVLYSK